MHFVGRLKRKKPGEKKAHWHTDAGRCLGASQEVPAEATCDKKRTCCECSNVSKLCMVMGLASQQERPSVGCGKDVPQIQVKHNPARAAAKKTAEDR